MVVLLQTRLPCPECQPASATTQQQAFLSEGSGHCSLCCPTATNQPTRQVTLSFNSPYKRANFRDDFLVYDHTTGKTPVLVLCKRGEGEISGFFGQKFAIHRLKHLNSFAKTSGYLLDRIFFIWNILNDIFQQKSISSTRSH